MPPMKALGGGEAAVVGLVHLRGLAVLVPADAASAAAALELAAPCAATVPAARTPQATMNAPESLSDIAEPPLTRQSLMPFAVDFD